MLNDPKAAADELSKLFTAPITVTHDTYSRKPALRVTRADEYAVPEYTGDGGLYGLTQALAKACGGNVVGEVGTISEQGCETCDWGSLYGIEYLVWEE